MTSTPAGRVATGRDLARWRRHLASERAEAEMYRRLARRRDGEEREVLLALAEAEARHAAHWERLLGPHSGPARVSLHTRLLVLLAGRFGSVFVLALAQRFEARTPYDRDADATPAMAADERVHEEVVRGLAARGRARVSGTFRAAVFGANDGLVSNLALVLGVAGGGVGRATVLLTGLAGLLAGALSMGAGEWISVRSQRELLHASAPGDATGLLPHLDVDANELALVYRARGLSAEDAERRARAVLARAEPAHDPVDESALEAVGGDLRAAVSSFCFFAVGAAVPVLPFLLGLSGAAALLTACALVGVALLLTGGTVGVLSGASPFSRAFRQLGIGLGAAGVTFVVGRLFGTVVG